MWLRCCSLMTHPAYGPPSNTWSAASTHCLPQPLHLLTSCTCLQCDAEACISMLGCTASAVVNFLHVLQCDAETIKACWAAQHLQWPASCMCLQCDAEACISMPGCKWAHQMASVVMPNRIHCSFLFSDAVHVCCCNLMLPV